MAAKVKKLIAAWVLAGSANFAAAQQPPAPFPLPAPVAEESSIEIYYGTKRVSPEPMPIPEPQAIVPVAAVEESPRAVQSFVDAMASVRDGTREITAATVGLLGKAGDRVKHTVETRPIIIATYAGPAPVQATAPAAAPAPQVVVVREAVEPRVASGAATIRVETILLGGFGLIALGLIAWIGFRRTRATLPPLAAFAPAPIDPNSVSLQGGYNAGPKREAAEKFDIGPSYHDELKQQEQMVEANNTAAVEFILNQNLALLAALNPGTEGEVVHTDGEGFAAPALA